MPSIIVSILLLCVGLWVSPVAALAQFRPVNPLNTHFRVVAIVPMVGRGVQDDLRKPMLTELPGVVAWRAEVSDDGQFALVEIVMKERRLTDAVFTHPGLGQARAQNPNLKAERKENGRAGDVFAEFAKMKRGFRPERFGVAVP